MLAEMDLVTKLVASLVVVAGLIGLRYGVVALARVVSGKHKNSRGIFWARQMASLLALVGIIIAALTIWVLPGRGKAMPIGLVTAGLAVALQKVWTAFAGYLVLMRGRVYTVGDRVQIGDIRGDVMSVGFLYTRVMEMGDPLPPDQRKTWVAARQFTGRIVTVTNDAVFNQAVFNYTREFPFIYDEIVIPIRYADDRRKAEEILVRAAEPTIGPIRDMSEEMQRRLADEYFLAIEDLTPRVYYRLTDNWVELTLRFVVHERGVRDVKDKISRTIIDELDKAGIGIASATFEVVGVPSLAVRVEDREDDATANQEKSEVKALPRRASGS